MLKLGRHMHEMTLLEITTHSGLLALADFINKTRKRPLLVCGEKPTLLLSSDCRQAKSCLARLGVFYSLSKSVKPSGNGVVTVHLSKKTSTSLFLMFVSKNILGQTVLFGICCG